MKKAFGITLVLAFLSTPAFAQWGSGNTHGATILHRSAVSSADTWFTTAQTAPRTGSEELNGYTWARIDANVSVNGATIVCNLAVSNDSIWVSGDSLTFTKDSYQDVELQGGADYYLNIDSISSGNVTFYLTPFNK